MTKAEYKQLLIDTSAAGLFPSAAHGTCQYHAPDGKRCAVGVLIPPEVSTEDIEGEGLHYNDEYCSVRNFLSENGFLPEGVSQGQMVELQHAHDRQYNNGRSWDHSAFVSAVSEILAD